jgi:hypothetical protein
MIAPTACSVCSFGDESASTVGHERWPYGQLLRRTAVGATETLLKCLVQVEWYFSSLCCGWAAVGLTLWVRHSYLWCVAITTWFTLDVLAVRSFFLLWCAFSLWPRDRHRDGSICTGWMVRVWYPQTSKTLCNRLFFYYGKELLRPAAPKNWKTLFVKGPRLIYIYIYIYIYIHIHNIYIHSCTHTHTHTQGTHCRKASLNDGDTFWEISR